MLYSDFKGKHLSRLGFGTMRLPLNPDGSIDEAQVAEMTRYAMEHGVNYFDTAWPYHQGKSEEVIGSVLKAYPRESYYLADKYPGHQISTRGYNPAEIFEEQLRKCGVEYFDFYLLHNVYEKSMETYLDKRWGMIEYFKEQKRLGRIKHLGFSCHAETKGLEFFLDATGDDMEFCQIQLNYLDWTFQDAKGKYELLTSRGIPVWVMEPVRGGKLANLNPVDEAKVKALRPEESPASWGFRFLMGLPNVTMVLSGMSSMAQMEDNVKTFSEDKPLSSQEIDVLMEIAEGFKKTVPCTACRYCCDGCPKGLDIPMLLKKYSELVLAPGLNVVMQVESMPEDKQPSACIACGKCSRICPQNIAIPDLMKDFVDRLSKLPGWAETCRKREEAAAKK